MLRSALTSRSLALVAAGFLVTQMTACSSSGGGGGSGSGGSSASGGSKGSGGSTGSGGSGTSSGGSSGSGGKVGSGGSGSGSGGSSGSGGKVGSGGSGSGSGGSNGSGGSGTTGSGGSGTTGSGGSGTTGSGGSGTTGSGGSGTTGSGGSGTGSGGAAGGSNGNPDCPADSSIISDFEEGTTATTINPKGGVWNGYIGMGTMMPTPVTSSMTPTGIATATDGTGTCKGALHIKTTGATDYSGFGATLSPAPKSGMLSFGNAVDASSHKGIKFKIKSGSGTPAAVYFDIKTKETSPMSEGGNLSDATASNPDTAIGLRNNRGQMLVSPWTTPAIGTDWATITVPFGMLIPRWVPAAGSTNACPAPGTGVAPCQAPKFVAKDVLGIEFSVLPDPGFPKPSGSTPGTYDLWVDDVAWVDDDSGVPTQMGFPLTGAGSVGMCSKPAGADGKFLVTAYNQWKQTFVSGGNKVIRPENGNDTVSEGIAYGMLIAVNMNDKTLFDALYGFWKTNSSGGLMTWCLPAGSNSCSAQGGGSATDADEDAAFALIQAAKVFGTASYMTDAATIIGQIWAKDIDPTSNLPTGGSNYGSTSSKVTNPSYFAPAYYRAFAAVDSGHAWGTVADKSIAAINALSSSSGLVPAWCTNNCTGVGSNGGSNDMIYQYDSHRVPMRVGLDYCWNGTAAAQTYAMKNTTFFATNAHAGKDGIGRISDLYNLDGTSPSGAAPNSASIIGTAAVGAMAAKSNQAFLDDAYQAVFDMATRGNLAPVDASGKTPYSYYNATVGMLTLLIMTGNFSH